MAFTRRHHFTVFIIAWMLVIAATLGVLVLTRAWTIQPFSPDGSITSIGIGVDSHGAAHIVYTEGYYGEARLEYTTNSGGSWVTQTLASGQNTSGVRLALDSRDRLHIVYVTGSQANWTYRFVPEVQYLTVTDGGWSHRTLASNATAPSIALDARGAAYVAYSYRAYANGTVPYDNESLRLLTDAGGSWTNSTLWGWDDPSNSILYLTSIAVDPHGSVHLVSEQTFWLRYFTNATGSWTSESLEPEANPWEDPPSLALDGEGRVHLGFEGYAPPGATGLPGLAVIHGIRTDGKWTYESVDTWRGSDPSYAAMAVGANGDAHFAYSDRLDGTIKYATNAGGTWTVTTLEHGYVTGFYASIALDGGGRPHVAYANSCCGFSNETPSVSDGGRYATTVVSSSNSAYFIQGNVLLFGIEFVVMGVGALVVPRLVGYLRDRRRSLV